MPQPSRSLRTVQPSDWVATYFISVATLAVALTLLVSLLVQLGSRDPWSSLPNALIFSVVVLLVSVVVIGAVAALPCLLFFWLAQRYTWRHLWIYLLGGVLAALPAIPLVVSLSPGFFNLPYGINILGRYSPLAPLFGGCGAFLGAMFWWLSGRHLR
ncbi:hypothetical protein GV819_09525 [Pseudomonas sp. Fl5BN2]|uniref:hypothetical protein n=1 Tax=unclassified Pseudomonas TaxID=196821 RepID=UPI001377187A|nr:MULTISPECIES: hypothetical protein [unclassified Pseudomonas]NBF02530.1 hypothetical protein [Pseudomonas sp. Fl5BN2]NBF12049.1 hypothetical protein [Pseudomonas sp. Fl4BN1]